MPKEKNKGTLDILAVAELTRRLPRGYAKKVVDRLKDKNTIVSEAYVRNVKAGSFFSPSVLTALEAVAKEEDERIQQLKEKSKPSSKEKTKI